MRNGQRASSYYRNVNPGSTWAEVKTTDNVLKVRWQSSTQMPPTVTMSIDALAEAYVGQAIGAPTPSLALNNGFGDEVVKGAVATNTSNNHQSATRQSQGKNLRTYSTGELAKEKIDGYWQISIPLPSQMVAKASVILSGGPAIPEIGVNTYAQAQVLIKAGVVADTRQVKLVRNGARGSIKLKDAPGVTIDPNKDEWEELKEGQWVGHGHTTYSYEKQDSFDTNLYPDQWNAQTFTAQRSGTWSLPPNLNWQWNPTGGVTGNPLDNDSVDGSTQSMPMGTPWLDQGSNWQGSSSPAGVKQWLTYTVKDLKLNDGAKGVAKYEVTLHDEYEIKNLISDDPNYELETLQITSIRESNPILAGVPNPTPKVVKFGVSSNELATQEWTEKRSKNAKLGGEIGVDANKIAPFLTDKGITVKVNAEASIAVASETVAKSVSNQTFNYDTNHAFALPAGKEAWPIVEVICRRRKYNVWQFGKSGFVGVKVITVDTFDEPMYRPRWSDPRMIEP